MCIFIHRFIFQTCAYWRHSRNSIWSRILQKMQPAASHSNSTVLEDDLDMTLMIDSQILRGRTHLMIILWGRPGSQILSMFRQQCLILNTLQGIQADPKFDDCAYDSRLLSPLAPHFCGWKDLEWMGSHVGEAMHSTKGELACQCVQLQGDWPLAS